MRFGGHIGDARQGQTNGFTVKVNHCKMVWRLQLQYNTEYEVGTVDQVLYRKLSEQGIVEAGQARKRRVVARNMDVARLSDRFRVRRLGEDDVADVYALCSGNELYYRYCPPFVTEQGIVGDMRALPPNKEMRDKYYLGFYDGDLLIAVLDLIWGFPDETTAFIGFFMTESSIQNAGVGSSIIQDLCAYLKDSGIERIRLGWVDGNPQAERFWYKNGFVKTGETCAMGDYAVVAAERVL